MPEYGKLSAWISCDGVPLPEFQLSVDVKERRVNCWIPCVPGKTFIVHWKDDGTDIYSATYIKLDGRMRLPGYFLTGYGETRRSGVRVGDTQERPFLFMEPDLDDLASPADLVIGAIEVKIVPVKRKEITHPPNPPRKNIPRLKGKKTIPAFIGLGKEVKTTRQYSHTWNYERCGRPTYFVFRYRTREFLLEQGIVEPLDLPSEEPETAYPSPETVEGIAETPEGQDEVEAEPPAAPQGPAFQQSTPPTSPAMPTLTMPTSPVLAYLPPPRSLKRPRSRESSTRSYPPPIPPQLPPGLEAGPSRIVSEEAPERIFSNLTVEDYQPSKRRRTR